MVVGVGFATADLVVIGGGPGGLATALFAARRGLQVVLIERDGDPPDGSAEVDFDDWRRPGVPQSRQSHVFLGLGCRVLAREAPDVMDALLARGVLQVPVGFRGLGVISDSEAVNLLARRLVFEAVLRRAVLRESRVTVLADDAVVGLTTGSGRPPAVTGVTTQHGRTISAGLVVDATGRRSAAPTWLGDLGVADPTTSVQHLGLQYFTRFYRLRAGADYPSTVVPLRDDLGYLIALAFAADNATFSLTMVCLVNDPLRRALTDPQVFERALGAVPLTRPWLEIGEPISAVHPMARIENRWRRLIDSAGAPLVGNFVLVGDSAMHTNPTFGRGVSLALAQAQHLADSIDAHNDPLQYVVEYERWTDHNLGEWFATQVQGDQATADRFHASIQRHPLPAPVGWGRFFAGMRALAPTDTEIARSLARVWNLLSTPTQTMADTNLVDRVENHWSSHPIAPPAEGPDRATFESIVSA